MKSKIIWEYKKKWFGTHEMNERDFENYLNAEGGEGWELVQIIEGKLINEPTTTCSYNFIFKRVK